MSERAANKTLQLCLSPKHYTTVHRRWKLVSFGANVYHGHCGPLSPQHVLTVYDYTLTWIIEKVSCSHQGSLIATPTQQDTVFLFLTPTLSWQQLAGIEDDAERLCLVADCGGERDELTLSVGLLGLGVGVWSLMHQHSHLEERETVIRERCQVHLQI